MTLSEAQNILMGNPTPEDVERVAREFTRENPSAESIRTPDGKSELMAFALSGWDDEVPTQYSYKQRAWTKIGDAADESPFVKNARPVTDAADDPQLVTVTNALKKAFASFEHPQKEDWEVRTRRLSSGLIWVTLFRPWNSVFHAFDVIPGRDSFEIRESEYAKKLRKSDKPTFFNNLLPLFTDALRGVEVVERA